jgi:hypothetical protein
MDGVLGEGKDEKDRRHDSPGEVDGLSVSNMISGAIRTEGGDRTSDLSCSINKRRERRHNE